jgi:hypothetical protein
MFYIIIKKIRKIKQALTSIMIKKKYGIKKINDYDILLFFLDFTSKLLKIVRSLKHNMLKFTSINSKKKKHF